LAHLEIKTKVTTLAVDKIYYLYVSLSMTLLAIFRNMKIVLLAIRLFNKTINM